MKKLLVVIDMQNDFIDGALGTKEAQTIVHPVAEYIKNFDGDVVYTADTHKENYLETQEGRNLPVVHCVDGTHGWELAPEIDEVYKKSGICIYCKPTFGSSRLVSHRNPKFPFVPDYEEIEICGLCTDICVISNAMLIKAFAPESKITVHADLCAGVTPESHDIALKAMKACQINIVNEGKEPWREQE